MSLRSLGGLFLSVALVACGGEPSDGGTDSEGSTGGDSAHSSVSNNSSNASNTLTFTGSPPSDDGGGDANADAADSSGPGDGSTGGGATDTGGGATDTGGGATGTGGGNDTGGGDGGNPGTGGKCCMEQGAAGCGGGAVEDCVCAMDEFCCTTVWDVVCTVEVVTLGCGTCEGIGGGGDCCAANGSPGCDDDAIEACVCNADFVCCTQDWDMLCVDAVTMEGCGSCP